jgi:prepilin-type N-terminal cleavage/methylation domain-containing protein
MTHNESKRTGRGFTIIEMGISMLIIGVVLTFATVEFKQVVMHFTKTDTSVFADREARFAMARVCDELRQASQASNLTNPPAPVTEPLTGAGSLTDVKFYKVHPPITSADYTALTYDTVEIQLDSTKHQITETWNGDPTTKTVLGGDVQALSFTALSAGEYTVDITVQASTYNVQYTSKPISLESSVFISYYRTNTTTPG